MDRVQRLAGLLTLAGVVILALLFGRPWFTNASRPPRFGNSMLALQLARDLDDVDAVLGDAPSPDREVMRLKQYLDFAFIPVYTALAIALAVLIGRRRGWQLSISIGAALCGLATGAFDMVENRAILRILDVPLRATTPAMINAIRSASTAKWTLAAITVTLLIGGFARRNRTS
jgi:hypothetical protein